MTAVGAALAKPFKRIAEEVKAQKKEVAVAHEKREDDVREGRTYRRNGRHRGYARPKVRGMKLLWG